MAMPLTQHNTEIQANQQRWESKPVLRLLYREFHQIIAAQMSKMPGKNVELGSGIGNIREVIPDCLRTDIFPNVWLDQTENAYALSFQDGTVSNLILFDVFHHLRHPGTAFAEFQRVLVPGGRVIIFDPYISLLGLLVYGALHHEPVAYRDRIEWNAPASWSISNDAYYAAQGNATRVFFGSEFLPQLSNWKLILRKRLGCISYVLSGGYSKPQLYPDQALPLVRLFDTLGNNIPSLLATRCLVVLEKPSE